jgi:2-polyprenyl-6-methoxyphenol hydroxylase-like FAD-dependent oxidoreductase
MRVSSLVRDGDRVVGVRATVSAGQEHVFRASLVVGADGRHSTVARHVEAEEYLAYDAPRAMFWGYWNAPAFWRTDPAYPFGMYVANTDGHIRVIFQTDHDQLLIGSLPPVEQALAWRTDPEVALISDLASDSTTGPLVAGSAPDGPVRGTVKERYFFRRGAGNGWTLVGDAGHHKEFVIGDGITEALLQARSLASAIQRGTDAALYRWWRARDVDALPFFFLGQDEGALGPPMELQQVVFSHVAKTPALRARMAATMEHQLSPTDTFPIRQVLWWTLGAALRGSPGVVPQFLAMGRRGTAVNRELRLRRRLLAEAEVCQVRAAPPEMSLESGVLPRAGGV